MRHRSPLFYLKKNTGQRGRCLRDANHTTATVISASFTGKIWRMEYHGTTRQRKISVSRNVDRAMAWLSDGLCPARNSIEVLLSHTHKTIEFYSPDNLLALCHTEHLCRDWLIIDESGTMPIAQLIALCQHFLGVLMTTTVQGYEGTGRGFILKLGDSIPKLQNYQLTVPIRWAQDDPL